MSSRKELGKGIRALLNQMDDSKSEEKVNPSREIVQELSHQFIEIPISQIEANPFQPRKEFDEKALNELADSIKLHGLIQPITVKRLSAQEYQLISGERRLRASKLAGVKKVPAYIRIADDQALLEMALIENIQRSDLNAVEVAISYQRLIDECALTHESLSQRVGKDRSTVTNYLRLLKLPASAQQAVRDKAISMGHARVLAGLEDPVQQIQLLGIIINEQLSVRATEQKAQTITGSSKSRIKKSASGKIDPQISKIERDLSGFLGAKVNIVRTANGKGKIVIPFATDTELNDILERFEH